LSAPVTTKDSDKGENESLKFGLASMQGWRVCMVWQSSSVRSSRPRTHTFAITHTHARTRIQEDAHIANLDLGDEHATGLFAVFDGHGGKLVAKYAAKHLMRALNDTEHFGKGDGDLGMAFAEAFYKIDEELDTEEGMMELRALAGLHGSSLRNSEASKTLFGDVGLDGIDLDTDDDDDDDDDDAADEAEDKGAEKGKRGKRPQETVSDKSSKQFVQSALARDSVILVDTGKSGESEDNDASSGDDFAEHKATGMGCTAGAAMVRNGEGTVANTGDSRCVISRNGVAEPLTLDHKPVLLEEAERIMNAGGFVRDNRVNGALNVSRTLGDLDFKRNDKLPHTHQMVVATPDITTFDLQKGDEFMIIACDGIWDVLSNQEAVDFVRKRIKAGQCLQSICEEMCDHCLAPNLQGLCRGADNMSVIVLVFKATSANLGRPLLCRCM